MVVSGIGIFTSYYIATQRAKTNLDEKADEYLFFMVNTVGEPLWYLNERHIREIVTYFDKNEHMAGLTITDTDDKKIFEIERENQVPLITRESPVYYEGHLVGSVRLSLTSRSYMGEEIQLQISKTKERERLAAIGELSGNISHEMKNSLGVIDSSVYYLRKALKGEDEKIRDHLDRIKSAVTVSDGIIKSMADLTRQKTFNPQRKAAKRMTSLHQAEEIAQLGYFEWEARKMESIGVLSASGISCLPLKMRFRIPIQPPVLIFN